MFASLARAHISPLPMATAERRFVGIDAESSQNRQTGFRDLTKSLEYGVSSVITILKTFGVDRRLPVVVSVTIGG
jgi:hypothetical protein